LSAMLDGGSGNGRRAADEEPDVEVYELDSALLDRPEPAVSEVALYSPLARPETRTWPILEGLATGPSAPADPVEAGSVEAQKAEPENIVSSDAQVPPAPKTGLEHLELEWMGIVQALQRDAQPVTAPPETSMLSENQEYATPPETATADAGTPYAAPYEATADAGTSDATTPVEANPAPLDPAEPEPTEPDPGNGNGANGTKKRRRRSPVQDEWGFFDPDRAGFSALLQKLEEITDQDEPAAPHRT